MFDVQLKDAKIMYLSEARDFLRLKAKEIEKKITFEHKNILGRLIAFKERTAKDVTRFDEL